MYAAPFLLLAIMILLLPILGHEYCMSYLTDNISDTNIISFSEHSYAAFAQLYAIYRSGQSQKTCHPHCLRRACFEQASLTQSHYNFGFHIFLIIVTSAAAVLSGCGQQISDCIQSQSQSRYDWRSSVLVSKYLSLQSVGLRAPSVELAGLSEVWDFVAYYTPHKKKNTASQL